MYPHRIRLRGPWEYETLARPEGAPPLCGRVIMPWTPGAAVPVLAGSAAYAVTEASGWRSGMDEKPWTAPQFYSVIVVSTIVGAVLNYARIDAMRMLFWSAVLNGLLAPPLIIIILVVCNNRAVMGEYRNGVTLNLLGGAAALIMTAAAVALIASWIWAP